MKNFILALSLSVVVSGCATAGSKNYSHETHGVGNKNNPRYMSDIDSCKIDIYSKGINVDGEIITDSSELEIIEAEYSSWLRDEYVSALVNGKNLPIPQKYKGIDASRDDRNICLANKGWKK